VAQGAAEALAADGISAEVIDLRTIRPLDTETILESVKKTNRVIIIDESWPYGGISAEIAYRVQHKTFDYLDAPVRRVNGADAPMHYAPNLVEAYLPSVERVVAVAKESLYV
jgi:pyruvate dehydrogenase E1 component beta subunit